jgi:hypothetical protein
MGRNLYPRPPDMRRPATQELYDGELYSIINNGVRLTGMPAWGEAGENDTDSWALVHFIHHLPSLTGAELEEMKALNPRSSHERQEIQQEDEFLRGDGP